MYVLPTFRWSSTISLICSLLVAMGTVLLLATHTSALPPAGPANAAAPSSAESTVLVASSTIPPGSTISATGLHALFAPITLPAAAVPATAFRTQDQLAGVLRYGSRTATGTVARGQVLIASMLSGLAYPQSGSALANALPRYVVAIDVFERGRGAQHEIGTLKGGRGVLRFTAAPGPGGRREIVAVPHGNGAPATRSTVIAHYNGDLTFAQSTSATLTSLVDRAQTTTVLLPTAGGSH